MFSGPSTATPEGRLRSADVAGPPLPVCPAVPVPATVVIIPLLTSRTFCEVGSAMNTFPEASTAIAVGDDSCALVGDPPSPQFPVEGEQGVPLPANVLMFPALTSRTTWLLVSAM